MTGINKNGEINGQKIISNFRENHFRILIIEIAIFLNILPDIEMMKNNNDKNNNDKNVRKEEKNEEKKKNKINDDNININNEKEKSKSNDKGEKEEKVNSRSELRNLYLHGFSVTKIAEMLCNKIIKKGKK